MLLTVAAINQAIDMNDAGKLESSLENPDAQLKDVDETLTLRYLSHFVAVKKEKQEVCISIFVSDNCDYSSSVQSSSVSQKLKKRFLCLKTQ